MIYILIIILFILCLYDYLRHKQILYPSFIFNLVWFVTLLLYELKLSYLQHNLSNRTVLIFYCCVFSFNIIVWLLEKVHYKPSKKVQSFIDNSLQKSVDSKIKMAKWIAIIIFVIQIIYSGGVPLIWKIIGVPKTYFDFGIPSINGAFCGLIILLGAYSFGKKTPDKYIYLTMGLLMLSRQVMLSLIIEGIILSIIIRKDGMNFKKIIIIIMCLILGFTLIGNFRSGNKEMDKVFYAKEQYQNIPTSIKWIYSYMTFSISNFNNLVDMTDGGVNYGSTILSDLLPTVVLNKVNIKQNFSENYLISLNYTVSTYLPPLYLDFGIIGVSIFNMIIAFIGYRFYYHIKNNELIYEKDAICYSVYIHNIIFLFFNNMFLYLPIIVQFIYSYLIFKETCEKRVE